MHLNSLLVNEKRITSNNIIITTSKLNQRLVKCQLSVMHLKCYLVIMLGRHSKDITGNKWLSVFWVN